MEIILNINYKTLTIMDKMIKMPVATVKLLAQMFTSEQGINVQPIIDDLGGNRDLNVINLGLILKGNKIEIPQAMYSVGSTSIRVYKVIHASVLRDRVDYRAYTFRKQQDESWQQEKYSSTGYCNFEDWYNKDDKLPNDVALPEITEAKD